MEDKIQIILEAVQLATAQINQSIADIEKLNSTNAKSIPLQKAAAASTKELAAAMVQLSTTAKQAAKSLNEEVASAAANTTLKIAGMSYYVRSAIDAIRLAAAGGGARAGFYAIDEALRGVLASGLSLTRIVPVLGLIAAAAGAGYLVWREWTAAEREADKAAKDLTDTLKGTAEVMKTLQSLGKAGLLSPQAIQRQIDILTGKPGSKLYKDAEGNVTTDPSHFEPARQIFTQTSSFGTGNVIDIPAGQVANKPLVGKELTDYLQDQLAVKGGTNLEETEAAGKMKDLLAEIHAQNISATDLEIQKIKEKYQTQRNELDTTSTLEGKLLTEKGRQELQFGKIELAANEAKEISAVRAKADAADAADELKIKQAVIEQVKTAALAQIEEETRANDLAYQQRTISVEKWVSTATSLEARKAAAEKAAAQEVFNAEKVNHDKLLALAGTDKEARDRIASEQIVSEYQLQTKLIEIDKQAEDSKIENVRKAMEKYRTLVSEEFGEGQQKTAQAREAFQADRSAAKSPFSFVNDISSAEAYNRALIDQQANLQKILELMLAINKAQPGTFDEKAVQQQKSAIAANAQEQVKIQQQISQSKLTIVEDEMRGTSSLLATGAEAAKKYGKAGFIAYKALAEAQAVVATALAVVKALSEVPYPANIVVAAAAAAAGALQIATIAAAQPKAQGGLISGPGSGKSDSIPILASNREFMVRNDVVEQPGALAFLHAFNERGMDSLNLVGGRQSVTASQSTTANLGNGRPGTDSSVAAGNMKISVGFIDSRNAFRQFMRGEGIKMVIDEFQERGNTIHT